MKSFPPPLTAEEEHYYVQQFAQGNPEARRILIEHNLRLVTHIIKKYQHLDDDPDDLISIGTIGLIKAISTFNSKKNTRLATYACRCIENEILMMLRGKRKTNREVSLYEPIGTDRDGNEIQLYDILESSDNDIHALILLEQDISTLYKALDLLPKREKEVLILRYGLYGKHPCTQKEIAEKMQISRSYVSRIEKHALQWLRPYFI